MIDRYGWSDRLDRAFAPHLDQACLPGRVVRQQRGQVTIVGEAGELPARPSGRLLHDSPAEALPVAGDWVAYSAEAGLATIHAVLPRRTAFVRRAAGGGHEAQVVAANVDLALIVQSLNADFNPRRLERYLAAAWQSGARPAVALTKADLAPDPARAVAAAERVAVGCRVIAVSALTGDGMAALAAELVPGETCALLGSSGAGKSTLINALAGAEIMATGAIRDADDRGRHTTTHRVLVRLPGGALLLDTPGMRELGLVDAQDGLDLAFEDVSALAAGCRFRDCAHGSEPGCAVRAALEGGTLDAGRWRGFEKLQRELDHQTRREDRLAREAERRKWAAIERAQRAGRKLRERW